MNDEQRCAYVTGMVINAQIRAMGMVAENQYLVSVGKSPKYREEDFNNLITENGVHSNSLITELVGH